MIKKIQAASGAIFAVFVAVHLVNTALAAFGLVAYDTFQAAVRGVYQAFLVEVLLLAALVTHIICGIVRMLKERGRVLTPRARWHRYAGLFLLVVVGGHIMAVRGPSWFYGIYSGFEGLAFSIDFAPYYFFPYYFLLGVAGFYHAFNGLSIALPRIGPTFRVSGSTLRNATALSAVFMLAALLGLAGAWTDVGAPYESDFAKLALDIWHGLTT